MMTERRYWDSNRFLGWLLAEDDKVDLCKQILDVAERNETEIVTSALTMAEVLCLRNNPPIHAANREEVIAFFKRRYIVIRSITRRVAEESRTLVWNHGIKPKDALHVASAISAGLKLFNTFDVDLISKSGTIGGSSLVIEKPNAWELGV